MSKIKLLSDDLINQIAAGEIVERPASALKEIVENSIDAEASNIEIFLKDGGKSKIVVKDNGVGISREDLTMAIKRHATSKLSGNNLFDINSYGFRGEAIPSIASVSEFKIESNLYGISVNFSEISEVFPSSIESGTNVTISNLFAKLPARLKFLKTDSAELSACLSIVENFGLTQPNVAFSARNEEKTLISFLEDSMESRIASILGKDSFDKAVYFEESDNNIKVSGYLFHPMDSKYSQIYQKVFINNRIVKDKIVSNSLKNAYKDLIPSGRFAMAVIFIQIDPFYIDVNISPTKSEIRFRDNAFIQKFLTNAFKKNVLKFDRVSLDFDVSKVSYTPSKPQENQAFQKSPTYDLPKFAEPKSNTFNESASFIDKEKFEKFINVKPEPLSADPEPGYTSGPEVSYAARDIIEEKADDAHFFGEPIAQVFDSYILTKVDNGIMIIDQHAVHEKITRDKMLKQITKENKQYLIKPEMLEISASEVNAVKDHLNELGQCGFAIELIQNTLMISAIPAILKVNEALEFVRNLVSDNELQTTLDTLDFIRLKIANQACHNSIRFGRKLTFAEMKEIINQMENTPSIHQCNHHRPSFVTITEDQLRKMFNRS